MNVEFGELPKRCPERNSSPNYCEYREKIRGKNIAASAAIKFLLKMLLRTHSLVFVE